MYVNQGWYSKEKLLEDASNSIGSKSKALKPRPYGTSAWHTTCIHTPSCGNAMKTTRFMFIKSILHCKHVGNPVIPTRAMHYNKATIGKGNKRNAYSSWRRWWKWTKARIQTRHFWLQEKRRMLKISLIYKLNLITSNF